MNNLKRENITWIKREICLGFVNNEIIMHWQLEKFNWIHKGNHCQWNSKRWWGSRKKIH